jgi:MFS family permease
MRKKTIVILAILGFGLGVVGTIALVAGFFIIGAACSPDCGSSGQTVPAGAVVSLVIGGILLLVGSVLGIVAWVGALVKQAKQQQWGWFAGTLASGLIGGFLGGICMLIYLIAVPETPQYPVPSYLAPSPYQPGVQYPPMQSYQPMEGYPSAQPYQQPMPQYPPAEQYPSAPQQYPPQG